MKAESTTGDETAKTQKQVVIYLLADDYIEVEVQPLTMGDLCEIVGTDRKVADFVKQMPVTGLQPQETGRSVISVLMLVEAITVQVRKQFAGIQCQCVLLGAEQLIVEWGDKKTAPWWVTILKTVCVSLIILTGSAFTIMTYDQDVDVAGVFGRIYQLFVGHVPNVTAASLAIPRILKQSTRLDVISYSITASSKPRALIASSPGLISSLFLKI